MGLFRWLFCRTSKDEPIYSIINDDHAQLYDTLKELEAICVHFGNSGLERAAKRTNIIGILNKFLKQSEEHFKREEFLMELHQYPHIDEHIKEHGMLMASAEMFLSKYLHEGYFEFAGIRYLKTWLTTHIKISDQRLETFLNKKSGFKLCLLEGDFSWLRIKLSDIGPEHTDEEHSERMHKITKHIIKLKENAPSKDHLIKKAYQDALRKTRAIFYE